MLPSQVVKRDGGLLTLAIGAAELQCPDGGETGPLLACIRAEDVAIARGLIIPLERAQPLARVGLDGGVELMAIVTAQSAAEMQLQAGDEICAMVKATSVHVSVVSYD